MMQESGFLKLEFATLREEVKETKTRIFKLAGIGLFGMPGGYFVAKTYDIEILMLTLPILICILLLLYLAENHSLMRCGSYIRNIIEPQIRAEGDINTSNYVGWEHWLQCTPKGEWSRRLVDIFVALFFHLLFGVYYVASVELAAGAARAAWGLVGYAVIISVYIGIGIVFVAFLALNFPRLFRTEEHE